MAKVSISGTALHVNIGWFEAIRSLRRSFDVPLDKVRGVTEDPKYMGFNELGLRSPGTGIPGLVADGTFRKNGQSILSLWRRGQEIVVIELADSKWDRLVVGCDDAKKLVALINKAIAK